MAPLFKLLHILELMVLRITVIIACTLLDRSLAYIVIYFAVPAAILLFILVNLKF